MKLYCRLCNDSPSSRGQEYQKNVAVEVLSLCRIIFTHVSCTLLFSIISLNCVERYSARIIDPSNESFMISGFQIK